jgi:class 3 adenylate cyclase
LQTAPILADAKDSLDTTEQSAIRSAAYTAMLATLSLFFFAQWLLRRQERNPKLVAALMGNIALWFVGYTHLWDSVPWLSTQLRTRMEFGAMALVTFTGIPTLCALLNRRWTRTSRVLTMAALASALVCLLGPFAHLWQILTGAQAVGLACAVLITGTALRALLQPDQRWAVRSLALGVLAPTIGGVLDVFVAWSTGRSFGFLVTGVVVFAGVLSFELARRNAEARNASERFGDATKKFVPAQFLHELGHTDVTTAKLGDAASRRLTILFADIRNFTSMSERMTPAETFQFLNECLSRIGPHIRAQGGFVDKYIGDAIMALFPSNSADAVRAAIAMQSEITASNARHPDRPPLAIGVGIHMGDVMMGTIGEAERFEATVISDAVNLTARLESLTKQLGCSILISEEVYATLDEKVCKHTRRLGDFVVKGKDQPVTLYEVFESDSEVLREGKRRTRERFEAMLEAIANGRIQDATAIAGELRTGCPDDGPANWWFMHLTHSSSTSDKGELLSRGIVRLGEK